MATPTSRPRKRASTDSPAGAARRTPGRPRAAVVKARVRRSSEGVAVAGPRSSLDAPARTSTASAIAVPLPAARLWYGSLRLAPIEVLASFSPLGVETRYHVHARVADANVILNELAASVRLAKHVALLVATRDGGLRLHVAHTIPGEVDEHIAERARDQLLDESKAITLWRDELRPRVRVVDVADEIDRVELAAVAASDEDDLSTGALAAILGPGSAWSGDHSLRGPGLAEKYEGHVLALVIAIRDVCIVDARIYTSAQGAQLIGALGVEAVRAIGRLDTRGRLFAGAAVLTVITGATLLRRSRPQLRADLLEALQRISNAVLAELGTMTETRATAALKVPPPLAIITNRAERAVARVLAAAPAPLTIDEIGRILRARAAALETRAIQRELEARRMFVRTGRGLWQLGRRADRA